jgi:hypothetical protein
MLSFNCIPVKEFAHEVLREYVASARRSAKNEYCTRRASAYGGSSFNLHQALAEKYDR